MMAFAQQARTVKGKVTDEKGVSIPGVNVSVQGTTIGTITDMDGNYALEVANPDKAVLVFSFIGYQASNVPIGGQSTINAALKEDAIGLNEVVAIGYGVVKKRDLTGAVSSVKSEEIAKTTSSNAMTSMQGKVPGLDISQKTGEAGSALNITLRGNRSITANNSPLILVDGVEYGSTIDVSPNDIESMEVLKDAASTAIYGTRGANGVILITTKRGKEGKTIVSLNAFVTSNEPTNVPKMMYGQTEVDRRIDKLRYTRDLASGNWGQSTATVEEVLASSPSYGLPYSEMDIYNDKTYTNWADEILQNGLSQDYEISIAGGNEKTNFNISLGTMAEEGLYKNDELSRYNAKTVIDHKINEHFKVGTNVLYTYKSHDKRANVLNRALNMTSLAHPYNDIDYGYDTSYKLGDLIFKPSPTYEAHANPLLDEIDGAYQNNIETSRFFGSTYLDVVPFENLTFKTIFSLDRSDSREGMYRDYQSVGELQNATGSYMSAKNESHTRYTWDNTLTYSTDIGGSEHNITALVGSSLYNDVIENHGLGGYAPAEHYYQSSFYDLSYVPSDKRVITNGYTKQQMLSYFGRVNYKFKDRYLLSATLRADGSSVLSEGNQWGYFPSVALGWRINDESFMADINWLDNLKLRISYGVTGNSAVSPYQTLGNLSNTTQFPMYYSLDGKEYSANVKNSLANKELTWETTAATNLGLDFGIFKNRVSGSIDVFSAKTYDLLYFQNLPGSSVYPTAIDNIGETKSSGIEIALNTLVVNTSDFKYDINWSFSTYDSEITALSEGFNKNILSDKTGQVLGAPVNIYYDYETDGVWGVGEFAEYQAAWLERHPGGTMTITGTPGTLKIVDRNDDGKIASVDSIDDRRVYDRAPKALLGMNNTLTYKNLSLSVFVYARIGGYISYEFNQMYLYDQANWGDLDYWTPENQGAKIPSPGAADPKEFKTVTAYEDASFLKIKDITLAYVLPKQLLSDIGIQRVRVYGSLKNYFTFSGIDNYDPERGGAVSFPFAKQIVFGMNVEF
ncbi:MAG: TonB-dependent receptor [Nostocales cyanobacterium W4_Combined_metabat2_030]|nr:TonB-dependent receptor [Nostocales cyanobacterium W4_Combined_metabat2_030]